MLSFVPDDASLASTFVWSATDLNLAGLGIATNKQARRRGAVRVAYLALAGELLHGSMLALPSCRADSGHSAHCQRQASSARWRCSHRQHECHW